MRKLTCALGAVACCGTLAHAGGIERGTNNYGLLFEGGSQVQLSFAHVKPTVSGTYSAQALGAAALTGVGAGVTDTGDMARDYTTVGATYTHDVHGKLTFGLYQNDGYGANAAYTAGFYSGLRADWNSEQLAAIARYTIGDRISVFGGLRYVESEADILLPDQMIRAATLGRAQELGAAAAAAAGQGDLATAAALQAQAVQLNTLATTAPAGSMTYSAIGDKRGDLGYVLGIAYEIPDIALRVALSWQSQIEHVFDSTEVLPALGMNLMNNTTVIMPQTIALDFQSGVAKNTLVFGQVKWAEWSKWEVRTPGYEAFTGDEITGFDNDTITWRLGVGRKFSDHFSGFAQVTYEKAHGGVASRLSPTDGSTSIGIGGQFTDGPMVIRGGIEFVEIGDAVVSDGTQFTGNSAVGFGLSATLKF